MSEAELKRIVVDMAQRQGWAVHETPQVKPRRPVKGQSNGYPDLTLARDEEVLFLELKDQEGALSADQVRWMMALPRYEVVRPSDLSRGRVGELLA
jgi:predicted type IV restriction endonuclease